MDLMDEDLERMEATPSRSSHPDELEEREASEVHLLMSHKVRISRTRRMNCYLDLHESMSKIAEYEPKTTKAFQIAGVELKDRYPLMEHEEFKVVSDTKCLFFSRYYRMSFVLDLSPTAFTADEAGNIIYTHMLTSIFKLLKELVTPFGFPNSKFYHKIDIFVTMFAFCPYLHFGKSPVLLHSFKVNVHTFDKFKKLVEKNAADFITNLLAFMEPINNQRDKNNRQRSFFDRQYSYSKPAPEPAVVVEAENKEKDETKDEATATDEAEVAPVEEVVKEEEEVDLSEMVAIDFRLLQMLRLAMLGLYIGPENSHHAVFIVTDGVLYIPDTKVIQSIAVNLRTNCVPLFFIQIDAVNHGPSLGFVPSDELLCFLSEISFARHFMHSKILKFQRRENDKQLSELQKDVLAWSCQRPPYKMEPPLDVVRDESLRKRRLESKIRSNFYSLFHVRIREGYTLMSLNTIKRGKIDYIVANFCFPWTVDCKIDYQITANYEFCDDSIQEIHRVVTIETNYTPSNLITDPNDSALTAGLFLTESERFVLRVLNFSVQPSYYEVQKQALARYPGLYGFTKESYPFPSLLIKKLENSKFNLFWQPLLVADNAALHKCSHTVQLRFIIKYCENPRPNTDYWGLRDNPDTPGTFPTRKKVLTAINEYFKMNSTFCLVAQYSYVKIVREGTTPPKYCYMVKIFADSMLLTIKTIFIGDCSLDVRTKTVNKIKNDLILLDKIPDHLSIIGPGVDAKMIKYRHVVEDFEVLQPISMPPVKEIWETRHNIHYGGLTKFLVPKRMVWRVEKGVVDTRVDRVAVEAMNLFVRRRILEGFKIVFEENGILNMIREKPSDVPTIPPKIEQFIIFPVCQKELTLKGQPVQHLKEQLAKVGHILELVVLPELKDEKKEGEEDESKQEENPDAVPKPIESKKERDLTTERPGPATPLTGTITPVSVIERLTPVTSDEKSPPKVVAEDDIPPERESKKRFKKTRKQKEEKEAEVVVEPPVEIPLPPPEEVYKEFGTYIVTEYWAEPTTLLKDEEGAENRFSESKNDRALLSVLMTFRSMQFELDRAPGIGTALIGNEPYVMSNTIAPPIKIGKNVDMYPFLHSLTKLCYCGDRMLVLLPTLKFVHSDPHSVDRLGRILDSFNHEMRSYMPQCFNFEDNDDTWSVLAAGYRETLQEIDQNELKDADQMSLCDYNTDVEKVLDDNDDSTGTGYSSPGGGSLPAQATTRSLSTQMAGMGMDELTKSILGGFDTRCASGSGDSSSSPKTLISETRSTPALLIVDDDEHAEFMPSKKKSTPNLSENPNFSNDSSDKESKPKKEKKRRKKLKPELGGSTVSLASSSEKSKKRFRTTASDQAPLAFSVYYKRRDPKTVVVVIVPATCRAVLKITNKLVPKLPVLSFLIEEDRMLDIFRNSTGIPTEFRRSNVENFCTKGTLAHLNWQINSKLSESERETSVPAGFLNSELMEGADPTFFDLNGFVNIMHDLVFSRAYVQAAYHCLGTNIHVPQIVLEEVLEEKCSQTSIEIGSIQDVLKVTCTHLSSYLQSKRVSRYQRHQMPDISSSSSSESEIELTQLNEYQLMNPFCYTDAENDEICRMERTEFRIAFENVLRQHKFFKVPTFNDYYFYWPSGDNTVNLFNAGGVWNEKRNEDNDDQDTGSFVQTIQSINGSEISNNEEINFDVEPLFLQFYVNVPHKDDVKSYPVDFIPNCLKDILNKCDDEFLTEAEREMLDKFDVSIEMFVLTTPSLEAIDPLAAYELMRSAEDNFGFDSNDEDAEKDIALPMPEKEIILNLEKGLRRMLEMEKILILSRYFDQQRSFKNISRVVRFVEKESMRSEEHCRVQTAQSDMLFVIKPEEGLRHICDKLENALVSYCKIRSVRDEKTATTIFYCCSVEDLDVFRSEHKTEADFVDFKPKKRPKLVEADEEESTTVTEASTLKPAENDYEDEDSTSEEDEVVDINLTLQEDGSLGVLDEKVKKKQIIHDFWLLAKVERDPMKIKSFFFQRPNGCHDTLFKKFTDRLVEEIKTVNRMLLLDQMYETGECSTYLIEDGSNVAATTQNKQPNQPLTPLSGIDHLSDYAKQFVVLPSSLKKPSKTMHGSVSSSESSEDLVLGSKIRLESNSFEYSAGYFFCPVVWRRWFRINPRLRPSLSQDYGWASLKEGLENLAVRNHKNLYIFKESDGNVVYMYLFNNQDTALKTIKNMEPDLAEEIEQNMMDSVLLAVFGVKKPGDEVAVLLANKLQKKLDVKVMEELQQTLSKNPITRLKETDISFIQQNPKEPASKFYFSLPPIVAEYLQSVFTYFKQHLRVHYIRPRFLDLAEEKGKCFRFKPYPFNGFDSISADYEDWIYLVNKPRAGGQRTSGIGCFEVRLVEKNGQIVPAEKMLTGKLNADSFSLLYPGFSGNTMMQKTAKFHELTKTVQIEHLAVTSSSITSTFFVEVIAWQVGDIGLEELQTKLRIIIQQSLADLVVEFGIMSQLFLEPVPVLQSQLSPVPPPLGSGPVRPNALTRQAAVDQKGALRKRGSTITVDTPSPFASSNALSIEQAMTLASPSYSMIPSPFVPLSEATKPSTPGLQSPKQQFTHATKFPFDTSGGSEILGGKPSTIKWSTGGRSSSSTTTPTAALDPTFIPPLPAGGSELLRMDFIPAISSFFHYVERESRNYAEMNISFQKHEFTLDCEQTADVILRVIYAKFRENFKNNAVVILKQFVNSEGKRRLQTLTRDDSLMTPTIVQDRGHVIDFGVDYTDIDFAVIVYDKKQFTACIKQTLKPVGETLSFEGLSSVLQDEDQNFEPEANPFVPRRKFFFVVNKGEVLTLFMYNVDANVSIRVREIVNKVVHWNNARSRLLREIGLHKLQITHLSTLESGQKYQKLIWKDPELLISRDYPPDEIKASDFTKFPRHFSRYFMKMYRYQHPEFVRKNICGAKFDDQTSQVLSMRHELKEDLKNYELCNRLHRQFLSVKDKPVEVTEDMLTRFLSRCEEAHYVQTPMLLFPEWRQKIAVIRAVGNDFGSVKKRKQSAPMKPVHAKKHSMEPKVKPRSKTMTDATPPVLIGSQSEEPCSVKLQYMLASDYVEYLEKYLGARVLKLASEEYTLTYNSLATSAPVVWLQIALPGGVLMMNLYFTEPYFCIKLLFWNKEVLSDEQNLKDLRDFIKAKNDISAKCHLHSFTYDFHLRMVSTYLVGGTQLLFNRGYNTSAFLVDFLQYYNCRPPSARNCIFEEVYTFEGLKVTGGNIWENFLNNDKKYGWKVVRLKTLEKQGTDEFMLVSTVSKTLFGQEYEGVRLITNASTTKNLSNNEKKLVIKYYVLMVSSAMDNPMLDTGKPVYEEIVRGGAGEFIKKDQLGLGLASQRRDLSTCSDDEDNFDFGPDPDIYDSDARHSSGSNSDKSQCLAVLLRSKSITSAGRSSDVEVGTRAYSSPCNSPIPHTLVESSLMTPVASVPRFDPVELQNKLRDPVIQRVPPRGHRKHASISSDFKLTGAIPPEQVTYVHYFNNLQRLLQIELEEFAKLSKVELQDLVKKADLQCYVDILWMKLLSLKSITDRKKEGGLLSKIGNQLELSETNQALTRITSTDLTYNEWTSFLEIIRVINMEDEEARLGQMLANQSYISMFKFLINHFEGEKRCRFFDFENSKNLVITNPSCLGSATLFEYRLDKNKITLFMLFKEDDTTGAPTHLFSQNAIHKQFEQIMNCLSAYIWADLLSKKPIF